MDIQQLMTLAVYGVILLFVLVQWFLSLRPWFFVGLLMPLLFGLLWYIVVAEPAFFPVDLNLNEAAVELYSRLAKLGIAGSMLIFILCRLAMALKRNLRARARRRRVEEKRQRQMRETAAMMAAGQSHDPYQN